MDKQLTFETELGDNRQLELHIPTNPSVRPKDEERLSRQARQIYEMLRAGPVRTSQLSAVACQYGARVLEIRKYLAKQGEMIDMVEGSGGENTFRIVPLSTSTFWARVVERRQEWKWKC